MHRRSATNKFGKLKFMGVFGHPNFILVEGDMTDAGSLQRLVHDYRPEEVYNLAAQSHVGSSFKLPEQTFDVVATGALRLLEAVRLVDKGIKFYQASSSEMFGAAPAPQTEATLFYPRSPYAVAKCAAFWAVRNYRESYGIFGCNGILFNHEGELRGEEFVTRKITKAVARIKVALDKGEKPEKLKLGSLDAMRDWGYAGEYVEAMYKMLQADVPGDYVIATGESFTVEHFVKEAFACAGLFSENWVEIDQRFVRPCEVPKLQGDAKKAETVLNWKATVKLPQLIELMVRHDLALARGEINYEC
jgi:GDPmannose 4,6-dehydratase